MLAAWSLGTIGVALAVLTFVCVWLNRLVTVRAYMAFISVCLMGTAGWFGHILTTLVTWLSQIGGTATAAGFGIGVPTIAFIVLGFIFVHDLKNGAKPRATWLAFVTAAFLVAGVANIPLVNSIPSTVRSVVSNAKTIGS